MLPLRFACLRWLTTLTLLSLIMGCGGEPSKPPSSDGTPPPELGEPATSTGSLKRIIILTNGNSPFWDAGAAGARDAEKDLNCAADGFRVVVDRNDFKAEGQIDKLRQYAGATDIVAV